MTFNIELKEKNLLIYPYRLLCSFIIVFPLIFIYNVFTIGLINSFIYSPMTAILLSPIAFLVLLFEPTFSLKIEQLEKNMILKKVPFIKSSLSKFFINPLSEKIVFKSDAKRIILASDFNPKDKQKLFLLFKLAKSVNYYGLTELKKTLINIYSFFCKPWSSIKNMNSDEQESIIKVFLFFIFVMAGIGVFLFQILNWLRYGNWSSFSMVDLLVFFGSSWAQSPYDWMGAHKIFSFIPCSVLFIALGFLIIVPGKSEK